MSWQEYVDQSLIANGKINKACIYNLENNDVLASTPGLSLIGNEYVDLVNGFTNPAPLFATGIYINGVKYAVVKADDRSIYGKKGKNGVINVKTKKTIIIGTYNEEAQPGEAAQAVERLGDYLIDVDY